MVFGRLISIKSIFLGAYAALSDWFAYRSLLALACRQDFRAVSPQRVIRVIQRFSRSRLLGGPSNGSHSAHDPRPLTCKHALMRVWELAETEAAREAQSRFKWRRVMASCNALYSGFESCAQPLGNDSDGILEIRRVRERG